MGKIIVLDENTSNKIAAGEVVERPASVVKELVENSIDAGASNISVEIRNGGISFIKVADNGSGIDEDDVEIAFERHSTSKIRSADDLEAIRTMGFRGEALASIASVSAVELTSRTNKNPHGTYIKVQGGKVMDVKQTGCPVGTTFVIRDLFYNTPARFKFLKKDATETGYVSDIISRVALANPSISFRLISGGATVIHTPGNNDLLSSIFSIYGKDTAKESLEISYSDNRFKIWGYAGKPEIARATRNHQSFYINGRYIKSKIIASAIDEAYKTFLMKNKFPFIVLNMEINPLMVDVNVHPTKMEVRFSEEQEVFRSVYHAVSNALLEKPLLRTAHIEPKDKTAYRFEKPEQPKINYVQENIEVKRPVVMEPARNTEYRIEKKEVQYDSDTFKKPAQASAEPRIGQQVKFNELRNIEISKEKDSNFIVEAEDTVKTVEQKTVEKKIPMQEQAVEKVECQNIVHEKTEEIKETIQFTEAKIIGQAFSTYILLQMGEELILIDQHAAHERIMYEKLKRNYLLEDAISEQLLSPVVIELTNQEIKFLEEEKEFFYKIGFMFENFGNNSIILRSVPFMEGNESIKELFLEILDTATSAGKANIKRVADETLYTIACKAAVKANKKLDDMEIKNILKGLSEIPNPYTCPHGRPTVIKLTKYELEKMFKRIV